MGEGFRNVANFVNWRLREGPRGCRHPPLGFPKSEGGPRAPLPVLGDYVAVPVALPRCTCIGMTQAIPSDPAWTRPHLYLETRKRKCRGCIRTHPAPRGSLTISSTHAHRLGVARLLSAYGSSCLFVANPGG